MVLEAAAGPAQVEEARQASVQELQTLRDSLNQAEAKTRDLEGQLENLNGVKHWMSIFDMKCMFFVTPITEHLSIAMSYFKFLWEKKSMNSEHFSLCVLPIHVDEY